MSLLGALALSLPPAITEELRAFYGTTAAITRAAQGNHDACDLDLLRERIKRMAVVMPHSCKTLAQSILRDYTFGFESLDAMLAQYEWRFGIKQEPGPVVEIPKTVSDEARIAAVAAQISEATGYTVSSCEQIIRAALANFGGSSK